MSKIKNKKILILGAAGFIGTNLVSSLVDNNFLYLMDINHDKLISLYSQNKNIIIYKSYEESISNINEMDYVFYLICTSNPGTKLSMELEVNQNIIPLVRTLDAIENNNVYFIFLSSGGTVYGNGSNIHDECDTLHPISNYGIQKVISESIIEQVLNRKSVKYLITRLSNPYGPGQNPLGNIGIITKFIYNSINNIDINVFGDGENIRDYIYIDDAITMIINLCLLKASGVYNIGSGIGLSINDVISSIKNILQLNCKVNYLEKRSIDVRSVVLNCEKYDKICGKFKYTGLETGIRNIYIDLIK